MAANLRQETIAPAVGPTAWRAADFAGSDEWIHRLSPEALADIERAVLRIADDGVTLGSVTREAFDLPALAADLAGIGRIIADGRGFVLIKGIDNSKYSEAELGLITFGLGCHLGEVVSQSYRGDRLGHVIDRGEPDRYYTRGGEIEYHVDPVDIVGLFCLRPAKSGGASSIASSMSVHNALLEERPELMETLYRGYRYLDLLPGSSGPPVTEHRVPVFAPVGDRLACFFLPNPARRAVEKGLIEWTALEREAFEAMASTAARPDMHFEMDFEPGDIQFLNNRVILHARADYVDDPEPRLKRHMLRVWMMDPSWTPLPANMRLHKDTDRHGGGNPARPELIEADDVEPY